MSFDIVKSLIENLDPVSGFNLRSEIGGFVIRDKEYLKSYEGRFNYVLIAQALAQIKEHHPLIEELTYNSEDGYRRLLMRCANLPAKMQEE